MHSSPPLPPLDGLVAVAAASRGGSFTAAAEELSLTHSAISRRIQSVESWLGTTLFERHGRGVRMTPAGQRFVRTVEQAFGLISRGAEQWRPSRGLDTVRISVVPSFAKLWLMPRMALLQGNPLEARIELAVEHRLANLDGDGIDLAIRYGSGSWPGLQATLLFRERLIPAAAPALAVSLGRNASPEAIREKGLIHDSDAKQWRAWFAAAGCNYRPRVTDRRFEDYDLVLAAAEAGLGVALARLPLALPWLQSGKLKYVSKQSIENSAAHYAITRTGETRPLLPRLINRLRQL